MPYSHRLHPAIAAPADALGPERTAIRAGCDEGFAEQEPQQGPAGYSERLWKASNQAW